MVLNKWNCCNYYKWNGFKMMQMKLLLLIILSFKWARHTIMTCVWTIFHKSDGKFITIWGCDAYWCGMCIYNMIGEKWKMMGWLYVFMVISKQKMLARSCFTLNFHVIPNLLASNMEYLYIYYIFISINMDSENEWYLLFMLLSISWFGCYRGYPVKRALSAMHKHGG